MIVINKTTSVKGSKPVIFKEVRPRSRKDCNIKTREGWVVYKVHVVHERDKIDLLVSKKVPVCENMKI